MIKTLIVEDDPMVSEINEKFLEKIEGFTVCGSCNSIETAKKLILTDKPDLLLLDMFFPRGKGLDLLKWIRTENIKCDVILITADRNTETVEEAFRYGAVDYVIKPFVFERFKKAMLGFKNRKISFENLESIKQETIDKYTFKERDIEIKRDENISSIKGFNDHTFNKILDGIKSMNTETFTAQQVADKVGVSRITARRYLDYLEREQKIDIELEYGKVGRPINKYKLKEE